MVINIDLDSWEVGYADGQVSAHLNAPPISTHFHIRVATVRAVHGMWEPTGINLRVGARPTL